jgi:Fe-S-cluster containining protein
MFQCIRGCSECCGCAVPLPKQIFRQFIKQRQRKIKSITEATWLVLVETEDGKCVYLGKGHPRCHIYAHRPPLCKEFGPDPRSICPYVRSDGSLRAPEETARLKLEIEEKFWDYIDRLTAKTEVKDGINES